MNGRKPATLIPPILAALTIVALTLYAYRDLPARPFAADDYQWLLNVQGLNFGTLLQRAFDPAAQTHFYRPLIWLLFWLQTRAFGLDPRGFHAVSLALHLLNAFLLGWLCYRLMKDEGRRTKDETSSPSSLVVGLSSAIVALHPAPFEAVVWISAQSELLAATLLLLALHVWLCRRTTNDERRTTDAVPSTNLWSFVLRPSSILSTLALGLALLAKESAVIGLPLLMLLRPEASSQESEVGSTRHILRSVIYNLQSTIYTYLLPALLTLAYIALQVTIERRNYLLEQGGYGLGMQVVLNPLRSLALLVAPLPGSEHADAAWLVPLGALVAVALLGFGIWDLGFWRRLPQSKIHSPQSKVVLALGLTLLPTAPFASPPDSRYLYLPVMAAAVLVGVIGHELRVTSYRSRAWSLVSVVLVLALAYGAASELRAREGRFAAASGPGGSLWQVATWACDAARPERIAVVDPPVAAPHVAAIVELACGPDVRAKIVGRVQVEGAIKRGTLVIAFSHGSAEVQRWP